MKCEIRVTEVRLIAATERDVATGLLGWVSFILGGALRLDSITLRRSTAGRLSLSYPERRDGQGRGHPIVRPLDDVMRRDIERQVLAALNLDGQVHA